jgi:hypothetical protein
MFLVLRLKYTGMHDELNFTFVRLRKSALLELSESLIVMLSD